MPDITENPGTGMTGIVRALPIPDGDTPVVARWHGSGRGSCRARISGFMAQKGIFWL
jgi:hypothetical protein